MIKWSTTFDKQFWVVFLFFLFLVLVVLFLPYAITQWSWVKFDLSQYAPLSNTIGGILGPFIAILAAALTFIAFWVQYKANQDLKKESANQRKDIRLERFEAKFYEMLRLHKENLNEINIADKHHDRKAIVKIYEEFRFCYVTLEKLYINKYKGLNISNGHLINLSYNYFFFGVGDNSNLATKKLELTKEGPLLVEFRKRLAKIQDQFEKHRKKLLRDNKSFANHPFEKTVSSGENKASLEIAYYPFDGHVSKLGHYYRHLYQTVKFVASNYALGLSDDEKYEYLRLLRAQLSNHEQAMLYYNSFFQAGTVWWGKTVKRKNENGQIKDFQENYFLDHKIIRNVPYYLTEFGVHPEDKFREQLKTVENLTEKEAQDKRLKELLEWFPK